MTNPQKGSPRAPKIFGSSKINKIKTFYTVDPTEASIGGVVVVCTIAADGTIIVVVVVDVFFNSLFIFIPVTEAPAPLKNSISSKSSWAEALSAGLITRHLDIITEKHDAVKQFYMRANPGSIFF